MVRAYYEPPKRPRHSLYPQKTEKDRYHACISLYQHYHELEPQVEVMSEFVYLGPILEPLSRASFSWPTVRVWLQSSCTTIDLSDFHILNRYFGYNRPTTPRVHAASVVPRRYGRHFFTKFLDSMAWSWAFVSWRTAQFYETSSRTSQTVGIDIVIKGELIFIQSDQTLPLKTNTEDSLVHTSLKIKFKYLDSICNGYL